MQVLIMIEDIIIISPNLLQSLNSIQFVVQFIAVFSATLTYLVKSQILLNVKGVSESLIIVQYIIMIIISNYFYFS